MLLRMSAYFWRAFHFLSKADAQTEPPPCPSGPLHPGLPLLLAPELSFLSSIPQCSSHSHRLLLPFPILSGDKYFSSPSLAACHGLGESPCNPVRLLLAFFPLPMPFSSPSKGRSREGFACSPTTSPIRDNGHVVPPESRSAACSHPIPGMGDAPVALGMAATLLFPRWGLEDDVRRDGAARLTLLCPLLLLCPSWGALA